jgi:ribosomal protein S18 acetylase RimI-like enzyme
LISRAALATMGLMTSTGPRLRRAEAGDAAALVRLRALMLHDMGRQVGGDDAAWRGVAEKWFAGRLGETHEFAAFVVEDPALGVISSAVGTCDRHAPDPANLSGLHGHISNISTDERCRRRGHARACLDALLAWFRDETEVRVVNLNATTHGMAMYQAVGFDPPRYPALQLRLRRTADRTG